MSWCRYLFLSDIEFGFGYDDSENYGEVRIFSIYVYFYGGD